MDRVEAEARAELEHAAPAAHRVQIDGRARADAGRASLLAVAALDERPRPPEQRLPALVGDVRGPSTGGRPRAPGGPGDS